MTLRLRAFLLSFIVLTVCFMSVVYSAMGLAGRVLEWCESLFTVCLSNISLASSGLMWVTVAAALAGFVYALSKGLAGLYRSGRALKRMPIRYGQERKVALIRDDSLSIAFTHGLFRPVIYLSTGLIKRLSRGEINAVLSHELYHRDRRDPLRFFLLDFISDLFFYIPLGGYLAERYHDLREKAADSAVIEKTKDPLALASALVKVAAAGTGRGYIASAQPASIRGGGGRGTVVERVSRLIGEGEPPQRLPRARAVFLSAAVGLAMIINISVSMSASAHSEGYCVIEHCSMHAEHAEKAPGGCEEHCER